MDLLKRVLFGSRSVCVRLVSCSAVALERIYVMLVIRLKRLLSKRRWSAVPVAMLNHKPPKTRSRRSSGSRSTVGIVLFSFFCTIILFCLDHARNTPLFSFSLPCLISCRAPLLFVLRVPRQRHVRTHKRPPDGKRRRSKKKA